MKKSLLLAPLTALLAVHPLSAQDTEKAAHPSPNAIVAAAPASDWVTIKSSDLLVMDLAPDAKGDARRVIIQLMPEPFSQGWIHNIRKLAKAHWWDSTSINRVQDNYVVQWGDAGYDNPESGELEQKALPLDLETVKESEYETLVAGQLREVLQKRDKHIEEFLGKESGFDSLAAAMRFILSRYDPYSRGNLYYRGWPIALGKKPTTAWMPHCYAMVGVGRNYSPDTGSGAELYTVIGHAPRHLDRNIALVGRIIEGMEHLSSLPRGKGELGFYADASKRVSIQSIRLGNELAEEPTPAFEYLNTNSEVFAKYADTRANRRDPFFIKPAGGADICNIPVPVRRVKAK
ncbi:MAG: peptidylprolyl isomerase [Parasphingorhabdus sp.]